MVALIVLVVRSNATDPSKDVKRDKNENWEKESSFKRRRRRKKSKMFRLVEKNRKGKMNSISSD